MLQAAQAIDAFDLGGSKTKAECAITDMEVSGSLTSSHLSIQRLRKRDIVELLAQRTVNEVCWDIYPIN